MSSCIQTIDCIKRILNDYDISCPQYNQWVRSNHNLSKHEISFLMYSSRTGEMINHYSATAHVDGNTSSDMQTMYYGMIAAGKEKLREVSLILPTIGVSIKCKCNRSMLHTHLKDTYHLADATRGKSTFVKLCGLP